MKRNNLIRNAVALCLAAGALPNLAQAANVGYYEMCNGSGQSWHVPPITTAGHTAVLLNDLAAADLVGVDVIFVTNCNNGGFGSEFTSRLADIHAAVNSGKVLVIHDRYVDNAESILPNSAGFNILRDFADHANTQVIDNTTLVTNGPGGIVDNLTLDGGTSSHHGFSVSGSLHATAKRILSRGNANEVVTFSYAYGLGQVIYSTIPLDFYLFQPTYRPGFSLKYAPNVIAYAASLVNINGAPTANAGPDQSVDELTTVNLDGSASSDPDGDALTYSWVQTAGPSVALSGADTATSSFQAPDISPADGSQVLTLELTVSDGQGEAKDSVNVTVKHVNTKPVADAGDDANVREGVTQTLNGGNSYDPDNDTLTYQWSQVSGPTVVLSGDTTANPSFVVPLADGNPVVLQLVVNDGSADSDHDPVTITPAANNAPVADAGSDDTKNEGSTVNLNGSGSSDPDGDGLTYHWTQAGGPSTVTLSDPNSTTPSFTAPVVLSGVQDDYTFSLVVTDDYTFNPKSSVADTVTIHVLNSNAPPQCHLAQPSVARIWPPNHTMTPVAITGISDSDAEFNNVTLDITVVTQDEPIDGLGDGDTSPDAVIQEGVPADSVLLRGERKGGGNGRVYRVGFSASDGWESCTGSVKVTVPHDRKGADAVDSGQTVDSTQP